MTQAQIIYRHLRKVTILSKSECRKATMKIIAKLNQA